MQEITANTMHSVSHICSATSAQRLAQRQLHIDLRRPSRRSSDRKFSQDADDITRHPVCDTRPPALPPLITLPYPPTMPLIWGQHSLTCRLSHHPCMLSASQPGRCRLCKKLFTAVIFSSSSCVAMYTYFVSLLRMSFVV